MDLLYVVIIYGSVFLGLIWSLFNTIQILRIKVKHRPTHDDDVLKNNSTDEEDTFVNLNKMAIVESIGQKIEKGANAFLLQEYLIMSVFVVIFGVIVLVVVDFFGTGEGFKPRFYAFTAFVIGSFTSMICGWIGMAIAVKANYRTTFMAT